VGVFFVHKKERQERTKERKQKTEEKKKKKESPDWRVHSLFAMLVSEERVKERRRKELQQYTDRSCPKKIGGNPKIECPY
jgi:hypothetical protein